MMAELAKRSSTSRARGERLETRVTADQKRLIEHAAALQGRSLTDFVLTSLQDAARRAIDGALRAHGFGGVGAGLQRGGDHIG